MLDTIYHDAGINTVSFADSSTALAVLTQQGKIRKPRNIKPGDVAFLARDGYVGIVLSIVNKVEIVVQYGWHPGTDGRRSVKTARLNRDLSVLAVADPDLRVKTSPALQVLEPTDRKQIADRLSTHPAVDTYVAPEHFATAYARWQRYCGYGPDKATGEPDARSLERLGRESR